MELQLKKPASESRDKKLLEFLQWGSITWPLFSEGARAPPDPSGREEDRTREGLEIEFTTPQFTHTAFSI